MPYVLCPSCHRPSPADEYIQCDARSTERFVLCPECFACIPLPAATEEHREVLPELEAA
jgi:hypothetical protein